MSEGGGGGDEGRERDEDEPELSWLPAELLDGAHGLDEQLLDIQRKLLRAKLFGGGSVVRLAGYELIAEIGRGAMGVVYAARDPRLDRKVALKLVQDGAEPELRRRLVREARAMAKLDHPNVVPIYEIHETPSLAFIVMALVEGQTLRAWQEHEPRTHEQLLEAYLAAGEGLAAAHQKGLVHRDFKPDNVMIDAGGKVRVMDFGLAQLDGSREQTLALAAQTQVPRGTWNGARALTQTGALIGTPAYMAPEQLHGRRADAGSDQFGFCVALYEALHGERPFAEGSFEEMRAAVSAGELREDEGERGREVSEALRAVLSRGLDPQPMRRFPSMEALLAALREAAVPGAEARYASDTMLRSEASGGARTGAGQTGAAGSGAEGTEGGASMEAPAREPTLVMDGGDGGRGAGPSGSHRALPLSFNGYELLDKLGEGGMGEVWSARRRGLGDSVKRVAIKLIAARHYEDEYLRELFLTEARLSMLLNNSRIVQVFDVGEVGSSCYMAMEWVDGLNLAELTRGLRKHGARLSHAQAAFILAELLRALTYAHEPTEERDHPLIHRDISPQNVMVSLTGEVKLMDFGIATLMSEDSSGGGVKGKPRYMPPEQFVDGVRRPTIDLFALGAIFHELVDNRVFRSQAVDNGELYGMIVSGRHPPLAEPLPPELEALRVGLLEPDPLARIPSAREALRQLRAWPGFRDSSEELEGLARELSGRGSLEMLPDAGRISGRHKALSLDPSGDAPIDKGAARALGRAATLPSGSTPIPDALAAGGGESSADEGGRRLPLLLLLAAPLLLLAGIYGLWRDEGSAEGERLAIEGGQLEGLDASKAPSKKVPPSEPRVPEPRGPEPSGDAEQDEETEAGERAASEGASSSGLPASEPEAKPREPEPDEQGATKRDDRGGQARPSSSTGGGAEPAGPVKVAIEQHGQFCVDVRLGGQVEASIERKARSVEREPGALSYAVRLCGEQQWAKSGRVQLQAGGPATLYVDWPRQAPEPTVVELR